MASHGKIEEFDEQVRCSRSEYIERLEYYFIANDIEDVRKKLSVLLSVCGGKTYKLIRNLVAPEKPGEKTFNELVKIVGDHKDPPPSSCVQRCKFNTRVRAPGESVAVFVSELRRLSQHCDFGRSLDEMLRDRLICGVKDDRI